MEINKDCRLILKDIYSYDIKRCHYTILEKKGIDVSRIDKNNKLKRNIQIGQLMSRNPRISSMLQNVTKSIIDDYISKNNLKSEEIILRQYDGIIINRLLKETTNQSISLDLRNVFQIFISSFNRKMYIAFNGTQETIKGVSFRYKEIDKIYRKIVKINFINKVSIFRSLQRIKDDFFNCRNPSLFCIPNSQGKYNIFLKRYNQIEISKQTIKILDTDDIDKQYYFDFYIKPFIQSIISEFI